jgi:hypothetical protein
MGKKAAQIVRPFSFSGRSGQPGNEKSRPKGRL